MKVNLLKMLIFILSKNTAMFFILNIPLLPIFYSLLNSTPDQLNPISNGLIIFAIYNFTLYKFFYSNDEIMGRYEVLIGHSYRIMSINFHKSVVIASTAILYLTLILIFYMVFHQRIFSMEVSFKIILFFITLWMTSLCIINLASYLQFKYGLIYQIRFLIMFMYIYLFYKLFVFLAIDVILFMVFYNLFGVLFLILLFQLSKKLNNEIVSYV